MLCERLLLLFLKLEFVWPAANLLMFSRIDCKSVYKVMSLFTEIQFSTDLAPMGARPGYWGWWGGAGDSAGRSWCPGSCGGWHRGLISFANFFGVLYPCLMISSKGIFVFGAQGLYRHKLIFCK